MSEKGNRRRFVVCVVGSAGVDLQPRHIYSVLPDSTADRHHLVRVVDESGEDYLYPSHLFLPLAVGPELRRALDKSERTLESESARRAR